VSLILITSELSTRKKEEEKQSKRKSLNEHKCLSLVTYLVGVIPDLGEDLIFLFVSCIECYSSCMRCEG
jgi:cell division protein FtsW (lipid II flippase)